MYKCAYYWNMLRDIQTREGQILQKISGLTGKPQEEAYPYESHMIELKAAMNRDKEIKIRNMDKSNDMVYQTKAVIPANQVLQRQSQLVIPPFVVEPMAQQTQGQDIIISNFSSQQQQFSVQRPHGLMSSPSTYYGDQSQSYLLDCQRQLQHYVKSYNALHNKGYTYIYNNMHINQPYSYIAESSEQGAMSQRHYSSIMHENNQNEEHIDSNNVHLSCTKDRQHGTSSELHGVQNMYMQNPPYFDKNMNKSLGDVPSYARQSPQDHQNRQSPQDHQNIDHQDGFLCKGGSVTDPQEIQRGLWSNSQNSIMYCVPKKQ